ncbi:MAG: hypothetical protein H6742_11720 [Alphaproteobacteria bacterium]|nr:hypothetical protein [Alphaproteobacteria bacterium]
MIFAVNGAGYEAGIPAIAAEGDLGVLQDTTDIDAWGAWQAEWRDLFVLTPEGDIVDVINLTEHDLADPDNQDLARSLFDQALP